eukprot:TRINITY_DN810_c0_g2_i1.p1 TRINITY_DN810_c0_g2~~TRINITY_DN810_c0_g2_i1.p1  ORF type:complete len:331 (-),score=86.85 TRINITY_DN810_c0_g2_i1:51-1013(-)
MSTSAVFYADLGKRAKDLLKKGFPLKYSVELEAAKKIKEDNLNLKAIVSKDHSGGLVGKLEDSFFLTPHYNVELNGSISTDPKEGIALKAIYGPIPSVPGLKATIGGSWASSSGKSEAGKISKRFANLNLDYSIPGHFSAGAFVKYALPATEERIHYGGANSTFTYGSFSVGGSIEYRLPTEEDKNRDITKLGFAADISSADSNVTGYYQSEKDDDDNEKALLGVAFYHKIRSDLEVGADIFTDTLKPEANNLKMHLASVWKMDKNTTLRTKFDVAESKVSLSYQQKLTDYASVTLASEINLANLNGGHKIGVGLNLSDV